MLIILEYVILISVILSLGLFIFFSRRLKNNTLCLLIAISLLLIWVALRTAITRHAPFANLYESLVFFASIYLIKLFFSRYANTKQTVLFTLPAIALLIFSLCLPPAYKQPNLLVPALQSAWLFIHVPAYFIGYISLLFFILFAVISFFIKEFENQLENELKLAFYFITLGLFTGAFWAAQSWGSFWRWDPKETWSLTTWVALAFIFHLKSIKMKKIMAMITLFIMLFTYLGVTFLFNGLHSYR